MRTRSSGWLAWSLWALTMTLEVAAIWLWLRNRSLGGETIAAQVFLVPGFATVGAAIAARRGNTIGWLFVGLGLVAALHALSMVYGERVTLVGSGSLPAGSVAQALGGWLWPVNYLLLALIVLLFPDGRLPSPRWRSTARLIVGSWCLSITLNALAPSHDNPLGLQALQHPALKLLTDVVNAVAAVGLVVLVAAPFMRFRRAGFNQRQQLKWVAFIALLSMLGVLAGIGLSRVLPAAGILGVLGVLGIAVGIPVAVAAAILRHRLYDIDRIINRTLVYALLTAVLGLGYAAGSLVFILVTGVGSGPPSWLVAAGTLAAAAVFGPVRRRIQAAVDRRFNRRRYNAAKTIEAFSARLRDQVDLDNLAGELLAVTDKTMQPTTVSLWLRPPVEVSTAHAPRWDY